MNGDPSARPSSLRWSEPTAGVAELAPAWSYSLVAGFLLAFNGALVGWFETHPTPGKSLPWFMWILLAVGGAVCVWYALLPLLGGQRLAFTGGVFRVTRRRGGDERFALGIREIDRFEAIPSGEGAQVQVVSADGVHRSLPLDFKNPLFSVSRQTPKDDPRRREHGLAEAHHIAQRLQAMLVAARASQGYRA